MSLRALGLAAVLLVAGCTSSGNGHAAIDPATVDCHDPTLTQAQYVAACGPAHLSTESAPAPASSMPAPATGPQDFTYPDGGRVSVSNVEKIAGTRCYEIQSAETCVLIQISLTNTGVAPIVLGDNTDLSYMTVYYGANQYEAKFAGYQGDPGSSTFPRQCVPGSTIMTGEVYRIPNDGLSTLLVNFKSPEADDTQVFQPHAFADVQTLLH